MGVVEVNETWDGRGMKYSDDFHREYRRTLRVRCDTLLISPTYILFHPLIPRLGSPYYLQGYENDIGARCVDVDAKQDSEDPFIWVVTCDYSSRSRDPSKQAQSGGGGSSGGGGGGGGEGQSPSPNPLSKPTTIRWGTVHDRVIAERSVKASIGGPQFRGGDTTINLTGTPDAGVGSESLDLLLNPTQYWTTNATVITNTAGQTYVPRLEKDASRPTLNVTRNEKSFPIDTLNHVDKVNSKRFAGFKARQVKLQSLTADYQFENNQGFWMVSYSFEMRLPDWDVILVQKGTRARTKFGELAVDIVDGVPPSGPVDVDQYGFVQKNKDSTTGKLKQFYVKHALYEEADFESLFKFGSPT